MAVDAQCDSHCPFRQGLGHVEIAADIKLDQYEHERVELVSAVWSKPEHTVVTDADGSFFLGAPVVAPLRIVIFRGLRSISTRLAKDTIVNDTEIGTDKH